MSGLQCAKSYQPGNSEPPQFKLIANKFPACLLRDLGRNFQVFVAVPNPNFYDCGACGVYDSIVLHSVESNLVVSVGTKEDPPKLSFRITRKYNFLVDCSAEKTHKRENTGQVKVKASITFGNKLQG